MKCKAITSTGEQCQRDALEGSEYCGLPAHKNQEEKQENEGMLPRVKNIVRYIDKAGRNTELSWSSDRVDEYISYWVDLGYTLVNTHYLGESSDPDAYGVLYILVKYD